MEGNFNKCIADEIIVDFLLNNLSSEIAGEIEEHFSSCQVCTEKARVFNEAFAVLHSLKAKVHGKVLQNLCWDAVIFPAAGSYANNGISETKSVNGRFALRLIPFLDENKSILEISVLEKHINGVITIENEQGVIFKSMTYHGVASEEVENPIDLRSIFIKIENV